jgi:tRNA threonylcarbamoyladenosine biosynthesis protein TsaB
MLTLAIDTATKVCTIALCRDKEILAEYTINMGMTHSEGLLPQLDQLLQRTGVQKQDIELLAVSMGPGSFTGLRIGQRQRLWPTAGSAVCTELIL